jgi:hypothetical protein
MELFGQFAATTPALREHPPLESVSGVGSISPAGLAVMPGAIITLAGLDLVTGMPVMIYVTRQPLLLAPALERLHQVVLPLPLSSGERNSEASSSYERSERAERNDGQPLYYQVFAWFNDLTLVRPTLSTPRLLALASASAKLLAAAHAVGLYHRHLVPHRFYTHTAYPGAERVVIEGFGVPWQDVQNHYRAPEGYSGPESDVFAWARIMQHFASGTATTKLAGQFGDLLAQCQAAEPAARPTASQLLAQLAQIATPIQASAPAVAVPGSQVGSQSVGQSGSQTGSQSSSQRPELAKSGPLVAPAVSVNASPASADSSNSLPATLSPEMVAQLTASNANASGAVRNVGVQGVFTKIVPVVPEAGMAKAPIAAVSTTPIAAAGTTPIAITTAKPLATVAEAVAATELASDGIASDGTATELASDGTATELASDGTATELASDGTATELASDGTAAQTGEQLMPDQTEPVLAADQALEAVVEPAIPAAPAAPAIAAHQSAAQVLLRLKAARAAQAAGEPAVTPVTPPKPVLTPAPNPATDVDSPDPLQLGWNEGQNWRTVVTPANPLGANLLLWAVAGVGLIGLLVLALVLLRPRPASSSASPPPAVINSNANGGAIIDFQSQGGSSVKPGRLLLLKVPPNSGLRAGDTLALVPGKVRFPVLGDYRLRVSLPGYKDNTFDLNVRGNDQPVVLQLRQLTPN